MPKNVLYLLKKWKMFRAVSFRSTSSLICCSPKLFESFSNSSDLLEKIDPSKRPLMF